MKRSFKSFDLVSLENVECDFKRFRYEEDSLNEQLCNLALVKTEEPKVPLDSVVE